MSGRLPPNTAAPWHIPIIRDFTGTGRSASGKFVWDHGLYGQQVAAPRTVRHVLGVGVALFIIVEVHHGVYALDRMFLRPEFVPTLLTLDNHHIIVTPFQPWGML